MAAAAAAHIRRAPAALVGETVGDGDAASSFLQPIVHGENYRRRVLDAPDARALAIYPLDADAAVSSSSAGLVSACLPRVPTLIL